MEILQIFYGILCIKLTLADRLYADYIDDISQEEIRIRPPAMKRNPNFYKPLPKATRKPKPSRPPTIDGLCVRVYMRKKQAEELENPKKEYKPTGNRWHGSVNYDRKKEKPPVGRNPKIRDITPLERKQHKCYKWINSEDIKRYEWPAIIKENPAQNEILIEICCPKFGPVRVFSNTLCHPYCHACRNGKCIAPEVCVCHDGFVLTDNSECVFTCPISCLNGRCNLFTNVCTCDADFELDETQQFCRPICRKSCGINPLHNCTAPDVCGCVRGYSLTDNDCQPISEAVYSKL